MKIWENTRFKGRCREGAGQGRTEQGRDRAAVQGRAGQGHRQRTETRQGRIRTGVEGQGQGRGARQGRTGQDRAWQVMAGAGTRQGQGRGKNMTVAGQKGRAGQCKAGEGSARAAAGQGAIGAPFFFLPSVAPEKGTFVAHKMVRHFRTNLHGGYTPDCIGYTHWTQKKKQ